MAPARQLGRLRGYDLNLLVTLAALLRSASVTAAAQTLGVSQPAMSKMLSRMRREFDDPLMVREGNRMMLTPKAHQLLLLVDDALERVDQVFVAHGPFDPSAASRRVRIAANDFLQHLFAPRLQAVLRQQAPRLMMEFGPVGMLQPEQLLSHGVVDLIIGVTLVNADLRSVELYRDQWVCVACARHHDLPDVLTIVDFSAQPQLDVSPSGLGLLRTALDKAVVARGGQRRVVTSISTFFGVPGMLAGTDLLALVPRRALESLPKGVLRVLELDFEVDPFAVSLWWHNSTHADPLARWLREQVVSIAAKL